MGIVSEGLRHIEDVCLLSQIVCIKKLMKLTVSDPNEIRGHRFLTGIIFMNYYKEIPKAFLLV